MEVINIESDDEGSSSNNNNMNSSSSVPKRAAATNITHDNDHEYRVILLMDHREFGCRNQETTNFLNMVETRINKYFNDNYRLNGKSCEILSLKAADYMFVARKISRSTGQVVEERVFDLIIERKDVGDLAKCIIDDSKKYKPLRFFNAQMHKLVLYS